MPAPRMTTRRWMLAIAILAIILSASIEIPRLLILRGQYLALSAHYRSMEARYDRAIEDRQEITRYAVWQPRGPEPSPARLDQMKRFASYYSSLRAKYEHAARVPWQPIGADPAPPL